MTPNINRLLRADPVDCRRGAPMGQRDRFSDEYGEGLYLQRVRFIDGDYAPDGTYWGGPADLWCAFNADGTTRIYARAGSRAEAMVKILRHVREKFSGTRVFNFRRSS